MAPTWPRRTGSAPPGPQAQLLQDFEHNIGTLRLIRIKVLRRTRRKHKAQSPLFGRILWMLVYFLVLFGSEILLFAGVAVVAAGALGEAFSLWALFYKSDTSPVREFVLWSMLGLLALLVITAARPIAGMWNAYAGPLEKLEGADKNNGLVQGESAPDRGPGQAGPG